METEKKLDGAFVGLAIIVIILIAGAIYIWQSKAKQIELQKAQNAALMNEYANSIKALEQDIQNTDIGVGVDVNNLK